MDKSDLAALLASNPDLGIDAEALITGEHDLEKANAAEQEFYTRWREQGGMELEHDCIEPVPKRKFRLDFAHVPTRIGIEIQGGVWMFGDARKGHVDPRRYEQDCEKANLAQMAGWEVYCFTPQMVRRDQTILLPLIAHMKEKANANH